MGGGGFFFGREGGYNAWCKSSNMSSYSGSTSSPLYKVLCFLLLLDTTSESPDIGCNSGLFVRVAMSFLNSDSHILIVVNVFLDFDNTLTRIKLTKNFLQKSHLIDMYSCGSYRTDKGLKVIITSAWRLLSLSLVSDKLDSCTSLISGVHE